ncbi:protoglobin domain-containing protein [Magnetospira sp. QH-2]|uniref:protoglobin domain-containing protein n=1 Tax=Magnetospira sp. (strain QH-2) TaxID=1288970 RepID=UPI0003E80E80|nr:protoglobin domain-containing protein [Magnetospira sp. QH-2]CCQ72784.1 protein of unknown function [Magnetospira sp. QH-2]
MAKFKWSGGKKTSKALEQQLQFTELKDTDPVDVADLWSAIEPCLDGILEDFYDRLERFSDDREFRQMNVTRLRMAQKTHWAMLFDFKFSADYEASVRRVGEVHSEIGLEPEWYIGGYTYFQNRMIDALYDKYGDQASRCHDLTKVLNRLIGIDMGLALAAYQFAME